MNRQLTVIHIAILDTVQLYEKIEFSDLEDFVSGKCNTNYRTVSECIMELEEEFLNIDENDIITLK